MKEVETPTSEPTKIPEGAFVHNAILTIDMPIPSMNNTDNCLIEDVCPTTLLDLVISSLSYSTPATLTSIAPMPREIRTVWDAGCLLVNVARMLKAYYETSPPGLQCEREVPVAPKLEGKVFWNLAVVDEKLDALKEHVFDFFVD